MWVESDENPNKSQPNGGKEAPAGTKETVAKVKSEEDVGDNEE
jgi:hypothetical protein